MDPEDCDALQKGEKVALDGDGNPISDQGPRRSDSVGLEPESIEIEHSEIKRVGRCGTFVNLINALIGAGIVGVPATFKSSGIGPTIILLLISCALCYMCGNILVRLQSELNATGIDQVALATFGRPGKVIISILCIIFSLSCCVGYMIIGTGKLVDWLSLSSLDMSGTWPWALTCLVYALVGPVPLTIPRHINFLSKFGMVSTMCVIFYAISITVKSGIEIKTNGIPDSVIGYDFGSGLFTAFSVHALTFSLPIVMGPVIAPYNPDIRKRKIVLGAVYLVSWILVSIPGMMAYLMKGDATASDVLSSFAKKDVLIIIVQAAIFLNVTCSYPIVSTSLIGSLGELLWGQNLAELLTLKQRTILIPIVNAVQVIIGMFLKDIQAVLGIGGALGGCLVVFTFPSLARLKITKDPLNTPRNIGHIVLVVFGSAAAVICTYFSVVGAIDSFK